MPPKKVNEKIAITRPRSASATCACTSVLAALKSRMLLQPTPTSTANASGTVRTAAKTSTTAGKRKVPSVNQRPRRP